MHSGCNKRKSIGGNYYGRSAKSLEKFCIEHRLSNVADYQLTAKSLYQLLKSFEKIFDKQEKLTFIEVEKLFFNTHFGTNDLLGLCFIYDEKINNQLKLYRTVKEKLAALPLNKKGELPERLLNGHDLKDEFGIQDGRTIAKYLEKLREAQLQGKVSTAVQARKWMNAEIKKN